MSSKNSRVIPCGVALIRRDPACPRLPDEQGQASVQFLISQRKANDTFGSYWEFPGGKKNEGESFEDCVVRETMEELGVRVAVEKKFMEIRKRYDQKTIWLNFYLCSYVSGDPRPLDCQKVLWADVKDLKDYRFPPANELVIDNLLRDFGQTA